MGSTGWMGSLARRLGRGGSTALWLLIAGAVAWGVFTQPEPADPYAERPLASLDWWLQPSAHPALARLPVRPVGQTLLPLVYMADWGPPNEGATLPPDTAWIEWSPTAPAAIVFANGRRHRIQDVQFSPDGRRGWAFVDERLLFATEDSGRTWTQHHITAGVTSTTGKIQAEDWIASPPFEGHEDWVQSVAFNPAGDRIVSGGRDRTVRLWTLDGKPATDPFVGRDGIIWSVAFNPAGDRIVSGGDDGTVRLWILDGKPAADPFEGHKGGVWSVAFNPAGDRIVSGGDDGTVRLWTLDGKPAADPFEGHEGGVGSVAFNPAGDRIASSGIDGTVRLWTLDGKPAAAPFEGHKGGATSVAFNPAGDRIVSGGQDGTVRLWTLDGKPAADPFEGHGWVWSVAFNPAGDHIVSGSGDGTVRLWTLATAPIAARFGGSLGTLLLREDGSLVEFDDAGESSRLVIGPEDAALSAFAVAARGTFWAVGEKGAVLRTVSGETAWRRQTIPDAAADLTVVAFIDAQRGWIAGRQGVLLRTENGGDDWTAKPISATGDLIGLHFQTNDIGWVAEDTGGPQPRLWQTLDNGDSWEPLEPRHLAAPWVFLAGIPLLAFASFVLILAWIRQQEGDKGIAGHATSDKAGDWQDLDLLGFKPIAVGISKFLRNVNTHPPLTIAVNGKWGTGKSRLMALVLYDLKHHGCRPVWFNAWHHQEEKHLLAALLNKIRKQAIAPWWTQAGFMFRVRLFWIRTRNDLKHLPAVAVGLALLVVVGWQLWPGVAELMGVAAGGGGSLFYVWRKLRIMTSRPAVLLASITGRFRVSRLNEQLGFRTKFGIEFRQICDALKTEYSPGLVIVIDDLDRCHDPKSILAVLESVNFLATSGDCTIIMGIDREQVKKLIAVGFERALKDRPPDEQKAWPEHFLKKLINVEVSIPELSESESQELYEKQGKRTYLERPDWQKAARAAARRGGAFMAVALVIALAAYPILNPPAMPKWVEDLPPSSDYVECALDHPILKCLWLGPDETKKKAADVTITKESIALKDAPGDDTSDSIEAPESELAQVDQEKPTTLKPVTEGVQVPVITVEDLGSGRWMWHGGALAVVTVFLMWLAWQGYKLYIRLPPISDSQRFTDALKACNRIIFAKDPTPRGIKRFQNRMRYIAQALNPGDLELDWLDRILNWIAGQSKLKSWNPEFAGAVEIDDPTLVAIGAIESVDSGLLGNDDAPFDYKRLLAALSDTSEAQKVLLKQALKELTDKEWKEPTPENVAAYRRLSGTICMD